MRSPNKPADFDKKIRSDLLCPISQTIMENPVIAADGHTYERDYIQLWINQRGGRAISPLTGEQLEHHELTPNHTLKKVIDAYRAEKPQRQQRNLTQEDLQKAIELREQEVSALLAKQGKRMEDMQAQAVNSDIRADRLAAERQRLEQEVESLKAQQRTSTVKDPKLATQLAVLTSQAQLIDTTKEKLAAKVVGRAIVQVTARKTLNTSQLQVRKEQLAHTIEVERSDYEKSRKQRLSAHTQQLNTLEKQFQDSLNTVRGKIKQATETGHFDQVIELATQSKTITEAHEAEKKRLIAAHERALSQLEKGFNQNYQQRTEQVQQLKLATAAKEEKLSRLSRVNESLTKTIATERKRVIGLTGTLEGQSKNLLSMVGSDKKKQESRFARSPGLSLLKSNPSSLFQLGFFERVKQHSAKMAKKYRVTGEEVKKVLDAVVRGRLEEVEQLLNENKQKNNGYCALLHVQGDITKEDSNETFKQITPWQFAMRECDLDMCDLFLKFFKDQDEERLAAQQMNAMPVPYYDLQPLIDAYKTLQANWDSWSWDERQKHWCEVIGGLQRGLPAVFRYDMTQPGSDAPWCKKTVNARPQKRDETAYGINAENSWTKGYENKYGLGDSVKVNGTDFGFAWGRARSRDAICVVRHTVHMGPATYHDMNCFDIEQAAVAAYRKKLQTKFATLLHNTSENASHAPRQ